MSLFRSTLAMAAAASAVVGQQVAYGQCGGNGYTGQTACVAGYACAASNDYYSQCVADESAATPTTMITSTSAYAPMPTNMTTSTTAMAYAPSPPPVAGPKYFITFGDSYSQTGFDITGKAPAAGNPLGNPNLVGYTTDNGLNWIGDLTEKYNTSLILNYNFAYGGATTDSTLVKPYASTVLSFVDQVNEFTRHIASGPWKASNSLFAVWIGVNDVGNVWSNSDYYTTLQGKIMDKYFAELQTLYKAGARHFVLLTVPPTNLSPLFISSGASAQAGLSKAISSYNAALKSRAAAFQSANSGSNVMLFDTTAPFTEALQNPSRYGAVNATCFNADGTSCLWWNNYHPGQAIQNLVAQGVAKLVGPTFFHA